MKILLWFIVFILGWFAHDLLTSYNCNIMGYTILINGDYTCEKISEEDYSELNKEFEEFLKQREK